MSNAVDCSVMSHAACEAWEDLRESVPDPSPALVRAGEVQASDPPVVASYDCMNDCASNLGAVALVSSAVAGLGCYMLPPACPAFVAAVPVTILEACDDACRELEAK